jgi:hypothetical protein
MAPNIIGPYELLAYHLVLRERGHSTAEIGAFIDDSVEPPFAWLPGWLLRPLARTLLPLAKRWLRRQADESQRGAKPGEFVFRVLDEHGPDSDLAVDILECAVCKGFARHDAMDVVPWICAADDKLSSALGLGLRRSGTRALGAERCDFRYKLGGKPQRLQID